MCCHNPSEALLWSCKTKVFRYKITVNRILKLKWTTPTVQIKMLAVATRVVNIKWDTGDHQHRGKYKMTTGKKLQIADRSAVNKHLYT